MNSTFTLVLYAIGLLCLLTSPAGAQDARKLTDFRAERYRTNHVDQLLAFGGRIYTANRLTNHSDRGRFGRIDPQTGTYSPLVEARGYYGGTNGDRVLGSFQVLDGQLFGRKQLGRSTDLYRIEDDRAVRLTHLIKQPLTRLVAFEGKYYFLVAGRSAGASGLDAITTFYTELWQTDGTPGGTRLVAELPVTNPEYLYNQRPVLVAGQRGLLLSGNPPGRQDFSYRHYYLHRPGQGTTEVKLPDGSDAAAAALWHYDNQHPEVIHFAGGFYLTGSLKRASYSAPEVYRIDEEQETIKEIPGLLEVRANYPLGTNATYAVLEDELYLHLSHPSSGYALHAATVDTPDRFRLVATFPEPAADVGLVQNGGTLYFGGSAERVAYAILQFTPGDDQPKVLFGSPEGILQANLYVGNDVIYAVSYYNQRPILRYRPSSGVLDSFGKLNTPGYGRQPYSATLLGDDLVYNGYTEANGFAFAETEPYVLERSAAAPRVLMPAEPAVPAGVSEALTQLGDGRLLLVGSDGATYGSHHVYDPADETTTVVKAPPPRGLFSSSPYYLNTIDGRAIFSLHDYDTDDYYLYALSGDSLRPLLDADTGLAFTTDDPFSIAYGSLETDYTLNGMDLSKYTYTDSTIKREIVERFPTYYSKSYPTRDYTRLIRRDDDQLHGMLYGADATLLYSFTLPAAAEIIQMDSLGYYVQFDPAGGNATLEYRYADHTAPVTFSFPSGTKPGVNAPNCLLGNRLIFFPYDREGGLEPYVADPATGKVERLADIHPGPGGSGPHLFYPVGNRLFFTADNGTGGTELWRTDGTVAGTKLLKDINPGEASSAPGSFYRGDSVLYFSATGESGREVFGMRLDDETVGTVADINPGPGSSHPQDFLEADSGLYVVASPSSGVAPQLYLITQRVLSPVLETPSVEGQLRLFPNPASGSVTLLAETGERLRRVQLYDLAGRLVRELRTRSEGLTVPVNDLAPGRYVAVVDYASGARRASALLIVR